MMLGDRESNGYGGFLEELVRGDKISSRMQF